MTPSPASTTSAKTFGCDTRRLTQSFREIQTLALMKNLLKIPALTLLLFTAISHAEEMHVFHSTEGKPLTASFVRLTGDTVTLKRQDGKIFDLPKIKLSAEDQLYLDGLAQKTTDSFQKLNTAAGQEITDGTPFPSRKAEDLARRLKLRPESQSKYGKSWRLYAAFAKGYTLFSAMPYSVALHSDQDGFATSISIVYANKGDFGSTAGLAQEHFKGGNTTTAATLTAAMDQDEQTINKALTSVIGTGKAEYYGEGKTRRKVTRWDWNSHAFVLSNEEGEYVNLTIISSGVANAAGRTALTKDDVVRKRLLASIVRSSNGDLVLSEIPMVDQGPKGYCVPATFERAMRTMGMEADMYLLAMVGESGASGGTSVELLLKNLRHQVNSKGRRIKEEELKQLRIRDIKRYLDEGIPVMWTMCSMDEYNDIVDSNTQARAQITDWKAHTLDIVTSHAKLTGSTKPNSNRHLCMIIGYNEATQELAVSDSWGPRFALRWVPIAVANWVSNDKIFMILP